MALLIVGSMAFDDIESPYGNSNQIVSDDGFEGNPSGGGKIGLFGGAGVGKTVLIMEFIEHLQIKGINTEGLQIKENEKSFYWKGKYFDNMNKRDSLATELNVLGSFDPLIPESYANSEYVMLGNLQPSVQQLVLDRMANRPKFVALDTMNFWMDNTWDDLISVLKNIDCLIINDEEARQLSSKYHLKVAAKEIMEMGPSTIIIKKGEHGALLFKGEEEFFAPALPLELVFDPTGAGDTFAGGFCGYLAATDDLSFENMKRAIVAGSALASFCVEKFGTEQLKNISKEELDNRIKKFIHLTKFDFNF